MKKIASILLLIYLTISCTEPYALQTTNFEDAIVVEATITNEFKKQEIKISRTYKLEDKEPVFEIGAEVNITDKNGNVYHFEENNGVYTSTEEFQAIPNAEYKLSIVTSNGKSYSSKTEILTPVNPIQDVTTSIATIDNETGVQINVNSFDPTGNSRYYRYEYDESYKIIAPKWVISRLQITGFREIGLIPKTTESRTCYSTVNSNDIIQTNTTSFIEDRVNFPIRFISIKNPIITHRYSILVKQYIQNLASYTYYETLKKLSDSGTILSQNQAGFINGNIKSDSNPTEKVIGYFEVSSVSTKRIFFNFVDLFPNEPIPPYFVNCDLHEFDFCFEPVPECKGQVILDNIIQNTFTYFDNQGLIYQMVLAPCGDCTVFSSTIKPAFWID